MTMDFDTIMDQQCGNGMKNRIINAIRNNIPKP